MKKTAFFLVFALLLAIPAACAPKPSGGGKLSVVASFYAMYDFTREIAGDRAEVTLLVPPGGDAHAWEPTARDMGTLEKADLFVCSGAGMEPFADGLLASLDNKELVFLETSDGIALLDEEEKDGHDGHGADPHVWLNPQNALVQYEAIAGALIGLDPENGSYYASRLEGVREKISRLDKSFREAAAKFSGREIVVSHAAFGYLCDAYGLVQEPIAGLSGESEPTPSRMAEIIDFMRENGVRAVFYESGESSRVTEALARETGALVLPLSPFESGEGSYFDVMEENLANLKTALE